MFKQSIKTTIVLCCVSVWLISCQTVTINTRIKRPSEVNMDRFQTVALLNIENDQERFLTNRILAKVSSAGNLRFIDQQKVNEVIEYQLETDSDAYSAEGASQIGELVRADVVIVGKITENTWNDQEVIQHEDPYAFLNQQNDPDAEPIVYYGRKGSVSLNVSLTLIEAGSGQIVVQKDYNEYADSVYGKAQDPGSLPERLDLLPLYKRCCQRIANKFAKVVTPYEENLRVNLERVDHPDFERGLAFAKNGSWDKAANVFREIQEYANHNQGVMGTEAAASAYYNYGVALQYDGDYDAALRYLDIAYEANPKKAYYNQIEKCKQDKDNAYRLGG
ncbi:hypothetical protein [Candidatus Uabimicrobium amorphum]|uniref:Curli production assembly/transport component CsgG n=1 Tax=Uabimicrobium amorphum TaxID=2596890 RepID=A0A5S9F7L4_UABAM|nr:hypothetical protein [Candidatus Uabimicrobium amorphum]BBM87849.1 hypothetical protein UABAM_06264 [Candidatus Uabimicrobium amorphum]